MLELTDGGRTIGTLDAIGFFETTVLDCIPEKAKTEDFCNEYAYALNTVRALARHDIPTLARIRKHTRFTEILCGNCGANLLSGIEHFCHNCGCRTKIDYSKADLKDHDKEPA